MARRQAWSIPWRLFGLVVLGLGTWLAVTVGLRTQAHSVPIADDGVPSGTIAYFSAGACPAGWQTATAVQGRLVVAVADGSKAGITGTTETRLTSPPLGQVQPCVKR